MDGQTVVVVVDFEGDFTEYANGTLPVPGTNVQYVDAVIKAVSTFKRRNIPIIATRDFHPPQHISFHTAHPGALPFESITRLGSTRMVWPEHCVQGTPGAAVLIPEELGYITVAKGYRADTESYSAFYDEACRGTGLKEILCSLDTKKIILFGIATDHCVKATALDAARLGYKVEILLDLCRGISQKNIAEALIEMEKSGIIMSHFQTLPQNMDLADM